MVHDVDPDFPPSTMDVTVCYWQERCMASGRASFICVKCSSSATTYDSDDVSKFIVYHTVLIYPRETSLKGIELNKKLCEVGHIFEFIQTGRPIFPLFLPPLLLPRRSWNNSLGNRSCYDCHPILASNLASCITLSCNRHGLWWKCFYHYLLLFR